MTAPQHFRAVRVSDGPPPLVLELVPPPLRAGRAALAARAEEAAAIDEAVGLDAVNIPEIHEEQGRDPRGRRRTPFEPRFEPRELALEIRRRAGLECIVNRVVVHEPEPVQAEWFRRTHGDYGVSRFVLVGGDDSRRRYPGPGVVRANELLREVIPDHDLLIGNICIPHRAGEPGRLARKREAGADFFTTQVCYQADDIVALVERAERESAKQALPPLLVSFAPVRNERNICFLRWLGVRLPEDLEQWLCAAPRDTESRSLTRIAQVWEELRNRVGPTQRLAVSLAPIGSIRPETVVDLAQRLRRAYAGTVAADPPASDAAPTRMTKQT